MAGDDQHTEDTRNPEMKTAREIIEDLERAYEAVTDIWVRHPEDGSDVDNRFETYGEYDEALYEEMEALSHAVKAIIEENKGDEKKEAAFSRPAPTDGGLQDCDSWDASNWASLPLLPPAPSWMHSRLRNE
jgi:hypothetical protein